MVLQLAASLPQGSLFDLCGQRIVGFSGVTIAARVTAFIENRGFGHFPSLTLPSILAVPTRIVFSGSAPLPIKTVMQPPGNTSELIYHCSLDHLLLFPNCIPRQSFMLWMAIKGGLRTKDKLMNWGVLSSLVSSVSHQGMTLSFTYVSAALTLEKCGTGVCFVWDF